MDSLIAKGWADKDRVASMGCSQGGYISALITASSDRFKNVSVGAAIPPETKSPETKTLSPKTEDKN